ncbi:MAG TPA: divalent-cation tolerance protein CutA [Planctomycetes bacterium]|nr:divalent-cation tolerance protein CutA [Planctomycetota bacterium]HIL37019.1 divalent-cation tolerance protein CutA [Planctomycetota bacterium]
MSLLDPLLLVFSTAPDEEVARSLAQALVEEGLAACVTALPGASSTYSWQGRMETSSEVQLLIKTSKSRLAELEQRLCALHPFEVPELLAVEVVGGLPAYLDWVRASVEGNPSP